MRLGRHHAWGAVLIALFVLPVLRPQGWRTVEEPAGAFFAWSAGLPGLSTGPVPPAEEGEGASARTQALEAALARLWERHLNLQQRVAELGGLETALQQSELDRLPRARLARVLRAHDPWPVRRSILIDRGRADGIEVGQPVVSGEVLLGRVRIVREHNAVVQLVTDPRARLEVFVRTADGRLLRGYARRRGTREGRDRLEVDFVHVPAGAEPVAVGAPVFTSNYDEQVPAHLLVGVVDEVLDPDLDRMPTLGVRPALDLDQATEVLVLLTQGAR